MSPSTRTIVVTGDVTIDWLLQSAAGKQAGALDFAWMWGGSYACRALASAGGAASHADILRHTVAAGGLEGLDIVGPQRARRGARVAAAPRLPSHVRQHRAVPPRGGRRAPLGLAHRRVQGNRPGAQRAAGSRPATAPRPPTR